MKFYFSWSKKPKIIYKGAYKLDKYGRRSLRRFLRANGIMGAIIFDLEIPKDAVMTAPKRAMMGSYEVIKLFNEGRLKQV